MKVIKNISMKLTKTQIKEIIRDYLGSNDDIDIKFSLGDPRDDKAEPCIVVEYSYEDGI